MIRIAQPAGPADLAAVRQLCWDYRDVLMGTSDVERDITNTFYPVDKYKTIMDSLEALHARPKGVILLARDQDEALGCGMSHALDARTCELKRVFTAAQARRRGVARALCNNLIEQARRDGYDRILLDTSVNLHAAQQLYLSLGFVPRGPYQPVPDGVLPYLLFFELPLR